MTDKRPQLPMVRSHSADTRSDLLGRGGNENYSTKFRSGSFLQLPELIGAHLPVSREKAYHNIWRKSDRASGYSSFQDNRAANIIDFDIDVYRPGLPAMSFNVRCALLISQYDEALSAFDPNLSPARPYRIRSKKAWSSLRAIGSGQSESVSMIELMQGLLIESSARYLAPPPVLAQQIPDRIIAAANGDLAQIIRYQKDAQDVDMDDVESALRAHFSRYPIVQPMREAITGRKIDAEFAALAFRAMADESEIGENEEIQDYLLYVAGAHEKASFRHAAVSALSSHMNQRIREIFAVRIKDEQNRTVAASLSAAIS